MCAAVLRSLSYKNEVRKVDQVVGENKLGCQCDEIKADHKKQRRWEYFTNLINYKGGETRPGIDRGRRGGVFRCVVHELSCDAILRA